MTVFLVYLWVGFWGLFWNNAAQVCHGFHSISPIPHGLATSACLHRPCKSHGLGQRKWLSLSHVATSEPPTAGELRRQVGLDQRSQTWSQITPSSKEKCFVWSAHYLCIYFSISSWPSKQETSHKNSNFLFFLKEKQEEDMVALGSHTKRSLELRSGYWASAMVPTVCLQVPRARGQASLGASEVLVISPTPSIIKALRRPEGKFWQRVCPAVSTE